MNRFARALVASALLALTIPAAAAQTPGDDADARAQAREIYARIIGFDTSIEGLQTPQMAAYLAEQFRAGGFAAEDIQVLPMGDAAALVVRYRGDSSGGRPIAFLGHMDVVTARRSDWERDPFTLIEENGFFFGRGALDNKAGIALLTATFLRLRGEGFTPSRDLILAFSGDEETRAETARALLRDHRELVDAEFAINSDAGGGSLRESDGAPLSMSLQIAEKTFATYTLTARNSGGHSSAPRADNAIFDIADAVTRLRAYAFPVMWNDATLATLRAAGPVTGGEFGRAMSRFAENPGDRSAAEMLSAQPGYVGQIRTTCIPTMIEGGHAPNALPQSVVATINCRIFPGTALADVQARLQQLVGADVEVALVSDLPASDASPLRDDVLAAVTTATHARHPGAPIIPMMSAYYTDGMFYRAAGIPTYGAGGLFMKGSEIFAHGLNERMLVDSFYDGLVYWRVLITELAASE